MKNGLTTIENVRTEFAATFDKSDFATQIYLEAWLSYSESRNDNSNLPMTFENYEHHMNGQMILENAQLDVFRCDRLGGKEKVIKFLKGRI
mgnify:CR=1 FL=1